MRTIRAKLALIFALFMLFLIICGILLNALFLEPYYIFKNKDIFISTGAEIRKEYISNKRNVPNLISLIDRVESISCTITDKDLNALYNSFPPNPDTNDTRLPNEIEQLILNNQKQLSENYIYTVVEKPNDQAPKLVFVSRIAGGELIILRKPMKGIGESVAIANQFYFISGFISVILGGLFIFVFSKKITKPVIEMSNVAVSISNLDFSKRVLSDSQDEIGNLGRSINNISEKLSGSMESLKLDVERKKQLVRNISHELKTPIGVIKGYAEGLKFGVAGDKEKTDKYCTVIADECNRMDNMVRELLNLSLLESGMFQMNLSRFDAAELIEKVLERFEPTFLEKGITLDLNIPKNLIVAADYELLERAINNYITNAINHIEGMRIIKVTAEKKESGIRISVFNSGKPIPKDDLPHIWDVFYKVDKARSRQYGGHGLGLSIVRMIAELHGGVAGVENISEGVLFFIEIP